MMNLRKHARWTSLGSGARVRGARDTGGMLTEPGKGKQPKG